MNKEKIIKMYNSKKVRVDILIEELLDWYKTDKYSLDAQQLRFLLDYFLEKEKNNERRRKESI